MDPRDKPGDDEQKGGGIETAAPSPERPSIASSR